jgi:hypothetical protein
MKKLMAVIVPLVIAVVGVHLLTSTHAATTAPANSSTEVASDSGSSAPAIPATGAYLGAWVNPGSLTGGGTSCTGTNTEAGCNEIEQLPQFNQSIGKSVSILHVYAGFKNALPVTTLDAIKANGSIPLIDWGCSDVGTIASGQDDATITAYAQALKTYGSPVFLRWFWEMNLNDQANSNCGAYNNGAGYIAAWQHIWSIFHRVGTSNVAFVWCPSIQNGSAAQYYPGDQYVDWISVDGYDRTGQGTSGFSSIFGSYYGQWVSHGKPIMIAETAAFANPSTNSAEQAAYLEGIANVLPGSFPDIKAVVYFDSVGPAGDWSLQGSGSTAFKALADSSYFITSTTPTTTTPTPPSGTTTPTPTSTPSTSTGSTSKTPAVTTQAASSGAQPTTPANATISATQPITVYPTKAVGSTVKEALYYLNKKLVATVITAPFSYYLDTNKLANGRYTLVTNTVYTNGKSVTVSDTVVVSHPILTNVAIIIHNYYPYLILIAALLGFGLWQGYKHRRWILSRLHRSDGHTASMEVVLPPSHDESNDSLTPKQ